MNFYTLQRAILYISSPQTSTSPSSVVIISQSSAMLENSGASSAISAASSNRGWRQGSHLSIRSRSCQTYSHLTKFDFYKWWSRQDLNLYGCVQCRYTLAGFCIAGHPAHWTSSSTISALLQIQLLSQSQEHIGCNVEARRNSGRFHSLTARKLCVLPLRDRTPFVSIYLIFDTHSNLLRQPGGWRTRRTAWQKHHGRTSDRKRC